MFVKQVIVFFCLLFSIAGTAAAADNQISGNVILNGAPIGSGIITLYLKNGEFVGTVINDGRYSFTKVQVPPGSFNVTVEGKGNPEKYSLQNATPLKVEVVAGDNHFDFNLAK
jgi:hypothetical protein